MKIFFKRTQFFIGNFFIVKNVIKSVKKCQIFVDFAEIN